MGSHFATRILNDDGVFLPQVDLKNSSADVSSTGGQMARLFGLAYASKLYRESEALNEAAADFSVNGDEVAFGTIGNASTSEGVFFEAMNAAGVLQVPMAVSVWDDGYGISVPNELQTVKASIAKALSGFQAGRDGPGIDIYEAKGWDYLSLCETYITKIERVRATHVPALFHISEVTQPQGHSTSGSHERYKPKERLEWEAANDCNLRMRQWLMGENLVDPGELEEFENEDKRIVEQERKAAWDAYQAPIREEADRALLVLRDLQTESGSDELSALIKELEQPTELNRKLIHSSMFRALAALPGRTDLDSRQRVSQHLGSFRQANSERYTSHLYSSSKESPLRVPERSPVYSENSETVDGSVVLVRCFDHNFKKDPRIFVVGEDVGKLGDVNKVFDGLQDKYGELRVTDTGIREQTILGQGVGAALRGLKPIVDIQYLDYLIYALQGMTDDLATLHYRTHGGQKAPVIIRTKGHRLQGIWHTGSPMGMILSSCPGIYLAVPRDMTRAAGFYNTFLMSDSPAVVIEVLSGYYLKERVPDNIGSITVPLGVPEVLRDGDDLTLVTYGACCRIALEAAEDLAQLGVTIEVIDVQTLNPFDLNHVIAASLKKTSALLIVDEDVPGGASAYILQKVLEDQKGFELLDSAPATLSAASNRSAYATDGQYYTKPNKEQIIEAAYSIARERNPDEFPEIS